MTQEARTAQPPARRSRVLFVCTGNTARSQMAQVLLEQRGEGAFDVTSAGLEPGELHPMTVQVLSELGLPTAHLEAKGVKPLLGQHYTHVITVCDRAEAQCPVFPHASFRFSWPFEDPAAATGSEEARLAVFRRVRDEIDTRVQHWLAEQV